MNQLVLNLPLQEEEVNHYFMGIMRAYRHSLPKGQRRSLFALRHKLLRRQCELSPAQQLEVVDALWQHQNTVLEKGYCLKEELKDLLHSTSRAELDAKFDQVISNWREGLAQ